MPESSEFGGEPPSQDQREMGSKPLMFYTEKSRHEDPEHLGKKLPRRFLTEQELKSLDERERNDFTEITVNEADRNGWMILQELHDTARDYLDGENKDAGFHQGVDAMMGNIARKMNSLEKNRHPLKHMGDKYDVHDEI